jgi:hypothetical protein
MYSVYSEEQADDELPAVEEGEEGEEEEEEAANSVLLREEVMETEGKSTEEIVDKGGDGNE